MEGQKGGFWIGIIPVTQINNIAMNSPLMLYHPPRGGTSSHKEYSYNFLNRIYTHEYDVKTPTNQNVCPENKIQAQAHRVKFSLESLPCWNVCPKNSMLKWQIHKIISFAKQNNQFPGQKFKVPTLVDIKTAAQGFHASLFTFEGCVYLCRLLVFWTCLITWFPVNTIKCQMRIVVNMRIGEAYGELGRGGLECKQLI